MDGLGLEDRVDDNVDFEQPLESASLVLGTGFGIVTDIETTPDGRLLLVSLTDGNIYQISGKHQKQ